MNPPERGFAPVVDAGCRVLVLGSLPGVTSLAQRRYYAHPRNQFWRLAGAVVQADLPAMDYAARLEALKAAGIGLWDSIARARRRGSGDAAIREAETAPLAQLAQGLPMLRAVGFNGAAAARYGRPELAGFPSLALVALPSSSAAHCRMTLEEKAARWLELREYLG